jgi:hypothetical protein
MSQTFKQSFRSTFAQSFNPVTPDGVSGVSEAPPTITTQPQSQSASEGSTATFTVVAGGANPKTYQWEISTNSGVDWADIVGATSASYTTDSLTVVGDDGDQFRCVVDNAFGSDTSDAATLTVTLGDYLLLEDGDSLLLETGDLLELEA